MLKKKKSRCVLGITFNRSHCGDIEIAVEVLDQGHDLFMYSFILTTGSRSAAHQKPNYQGFFFFFKMKVMEVVARRTKSPINPFPGTVCAAISEVSKAG